MSNQDRAEGVSRSASDRLRLALNEPLWRQASIIRRIADELDAAGGDQYRSGWLASCDPIEATPQAPGADTPTTTEQAEAGAMLPELPFIRHVEVLRAMGSVFKSIPSPCEERDAIEAAIDALTRKGGEADETTNPSEISSKLVGGEADAAYWKQQWEVANRELGKLEKDAERGRFVISQMAFENDNDPDGGKWYSHAYLKADAIRAPEGSPYFTSAEEIIDAAIAAAARPVGGDGEGALLDRVEALAGEVDSLLTAWGDGEEMDKRDRIADEMRRLVTEAKNGELK